MQFNRPGLRSTLPLLALFAAAALVAGCVGGTSAASPTPSGATPTEWVPSGSFSVSGFYLRVWTEQSIPPDGRFGNLPYVTIAGGQLINGMVATPAIYPGPIYTQLSAQSISDAGIATILAEARSLGMLGPNSYFDDSPMPGSIQAHIQMTIGGVTHELVGPPKATSSSSAPGTAGAFVEFLHELEGLSAWVVSDLGESTPYVPNGLAVWVKAPAEAKNGVSAFQQPWPLDTTFAKFGDTFGDGRCATVTGADLAKLLPVVQDANQLTSFVDATGVRMALQTRVVLPGEPGPCPVAPTPSGPTP